MSDEPMGLHAAAVMMVEVKGAAAVMVNVLGTDHPLTPAVFWLRACHS